jgi:hypothetical protein
MQKVLLCLLFVLLSIILQAQTPFTSGNLVVVRVGDGTGSLVNTGNAVFLDEYSPSGTLVRSVALPTTVSGANAQLILSGTATSEGALVRSADGKYLTLSGYGRDLGGSGSVSGTTAASVNRVVAIINSGGVVDISTKLTDYADGNNPRSAVTTNGTDLWVAGGAGGIRYATKGATTSTQLSTTITNIRSLVIAGGQLYTSTASGSAVRVGTVGTGLPTTAGQTITNLPGFLTSSSPYGFVFFDLDNTVAGVDVLYVADDVAGIQKFSLVGGSWVANGIIGTDADDYRGLTGSVSGNTVTLYASRKGGSTATGGGELVSLSDNSGYNATLTGVPTLLATATANTAFRGVAFAPVAPVLPSVNLSLSSSSTSEATPNNTITITATASGIATTDQTVDIAISGTGITASDYSLDKTTITIPAGQTTGTATLTILDDTGIEGTETATITISNPSSGIALGSTISQNLTINDNDTPVVNFALPVVFSREITPNATVVITATASAAVTSTQTVDVTISGTGITNDDYSLSAASITIASGQTTGTVTLTIKDDAALEGIEYMTVTLSNPSSGVILGSTTSRDLAVFDNDFAASPTASKEIELKYVSSFSNKGSLTKSSSEISAYDAGSKRLFVVNSVGETASGKAPKLDIFNFSNPRSPKLIRSIDILQYGGGINSVAARNGIIAVAIENVDPQEAGKIVILDTAGTLVKQVDAGAMPDMITFSPDGKYILTANEGEPNTNYSKDPEGSVTIVDISGGVSGLTQANVTTAGFTTFNSQITQLKAAGIRIYGVFTGNGQTASTVAQDLEPEYITFSKDSKTAYVTLQENNAIATLDIATKTFTAINPLGLKDHSQLTNGLDASDQSGAILISNVPVKGMYQPDAIASFEVNGQTYLVTANEGDSRAYSALNEEIRVNSSSYVLDPTLFPKAVLLKNNNILGRLQLTNRSGDTDGDGDFDEIHLFGARSFSIWQTGAGSMTRVYDSGDQLERITAADATFGSIFNAGHENNTLKDRSDNKGPEPEGVTTAVINNKTYAFITLERIGGVMVYNVTNPQTPSFVQYTNSRSTAAWGGDLGPEGIIYIPATESPIDTGLVVVSNEISSTISIFKIESDVNCAKFLTKPTISQTGSQNSTVLILTSSSTSGNQWYKDGALIAGATARTYNVTAAGSYTVKVTSGTCSATSDAVSITSSEKFEPATTELFPNPTDNKLNIRYTNRNNASAITISIINMLGKKVTEKILQKQQGEVWETEIPVEKIAPGQYFLLIEDGKKTTVKSFIKY